MAGDTFNKIKNTVNRGITTISIKTSSSLEKSKIKTHIDTLEKEVQKLLLTTGENAYSIWIDNDTDYHSLTDKFVVIKQKKAEIEQLRLELDSIDERDNQILGKNTEYAREDDPIICPECGSKYIVTVKFCRKCGYKF